MTKHLSILFASLLQCALLPALSPTGLKHSWVAGTGNPGSEDGAFMRASFNEPCGILHDAGRERLLVADRGNGKLRAVYLAEKNRTESLAFKAVGGGAFSLVSPQALAWIEDGRSLLCQDLGRPGLARLDLAAGTGEWLSLDGLADAQVPSLGGFRRVGDGRFLLTEAGQRTLDLADLGRSALKRLPVDGMPEAGLNDVHEDGSALFAITRSNVLDPRLYSLEPGLPAVLDAFGSTQSVRLTASPYGAAAPVSPWAFVQGDGPLRISCDGPAVMAYRQRDGSFSVWHLFDSFARVIGDGRAMLTYAWDPGDGQTVRPQDERQALPMVRRPSWVCEDGRRDRWYVGDTSANRIVGLRRTEPEARSDEDVGFDKLPEGSYAEKAAPGTHRIAVFGSSYFLCVKDLHLRARSFTKRLEWYLNFFSSLRDGPRFEAMLFNSGYGERNSPWSLLRQQQERLFGKYGVDEVLICLHPRDLLAVVRPYRFYPLDKLGLPQSQPDPEWALAPHQPLQWADPAYQALGRAVRESAARHSDSLRWIPDKGLWDSVMPVDTEGFYAKDVPDEGFNRALFTFLADHWRRLRPELEASARAAGKPLKVTLLLTPEFQSIGYQEFNTRDLRMPDLRAFRRQFAGLCRDMKVGCVDMVDEMRVYAMDQGTLGVIDMNHLTADGADLSALVASQVYLRQFGAGLGLRP